MISLKKACKKNYKKTSRNEAMQTITIWTTICIADRRKDLKNSEKSEVDN